MPRPGVPSLDQARRFLHGWVETGSFAAAARRLGRATSAISYAIANLRAAARGATASIVTKRGNPHWTRAGGAVLSEARSVSVGVDNLRSKVEKDCSMGWRPR